MSLERQMYLSPSYERIKAYRAEYANEHSGTHTLGFLAGLDWAMRAIEREAATEQPKYLQRPQARRYEFDSEGSD